MRPLGPFLPDIAEYESGAATMAKNVIPAQRSYRPFRSFESVSNALAARPQGAFSARSTAAQQVFNFAATSTAIYQLDSAGVTWGDVTRTSGGAYATPSDGFWTFSQFGDYIIACNGTDDNQYFDLASSTDFDALAGSPPIAKYSAVVRDFVVLGGLDGLHNRVHWSGINAPDDYVPSATTMSDYQDFPEGGRVTGLAGGDVGIVFLERAIYRMAFEGPPTIFRFDKIAQNLGCRAPRSIATFEGLTFFLAYDGLYMIRGASEMVPIGAEKVDRWLFDRLDLSKVDRVTGTVDPQNKLYLLGFASSASAEPDTILMYHWPTGQFSYVEKNHTFLYTATQQEGVTIDGLDTIAATIDELPFTLDSLFYSGVGQISLASFDTNFKMGFFTGSAMEATVETGFEKLSGGQYKSLLRGFRPMIEGAFTAPSAIVRSKDMLNESPTLSVSTQATSTGMFNFRVNARYHSARMIVPAGTEWTHISGIDDVKFTQMGMR